MKDISVRFGITQCIKKQRHHLVDIGLSSQSYGFSNSHVWMWKLDHKEGWALKNRCFWTVVLEKILENCLDCKKIKPVNPKGNQPWIFIGRTGAEAEASILQPWCEELTHWKILILGKIEGKSRRGRQKMRWLDGIMSQWTWVWANSGHSEGQGSLACYSSQCHKELDMT